MCKGLIAATWILYMVVNYNYPHNAISVGAQKLYYSRSECQAAIEPISMDGGEVKWYRCIPVEMAQAVEKYNHILGDTHSLMTMTKSEHKKIREIQSTQGR